MQPVDIDEIKVCTGCGHLSCDEIPPPHRGCCPDSNYIPLREYLNNSTYRNFQFPQMNQPKKPTKTSLRRVKEGETL